MANLVGKTVNLELVGLDGNAFSLMGAFQRQARKEKWTQAEIETVLDAAKGGDYDNLLCVLMEHCEPIEDEDDDPDWGDTGVDEDWEDDEEEDEDED